MADYHDAYVYFRNTTVVWMIGYEGGIFFINYGSILEVDESSFTFNCGIEGGFASVQNDGQVIVRNSNFSNNHAMKSSLIQIIDSMDRVSTFTNCNFYNNTVITFPDFLRNFEPPSDWAIVNATS